MAESLVAPWTGVIEHRHHSPGVLLVLRCGHVVLRQRSDKNYTVTRARCVQCWWDALPPEERKTEGHDPHGTKPPLWEL